MNGQGPVQDSKADYPENNSWLLSFPLADV